MPFVPPKSLQFKPEEVSPAIKARVHLERAQEVKQPHFRYLELWKGFELLYKTKEKPASKILANRQGGRAAGELDLIAQQITSLTRPRLEQLLAHQDIPTIMMLVARKNLKKLLGENELLGENGLTENEWQHAKKDLQFNLKANYWKAGEALARVFFLVRGAADPTVRKTDNLVSDEAILKPAYEVLRFAMRTMIDQDSENNETFLDVGERKAIAEKELAKRKPPAPPANAKKA